MWGFGLTSDPAVSIPGPVLAVPPGDDTLIINLTNELSVPVSIVIPGDPGAAHAGVERRHLGPAHEPAAAGRVVHATSPSPARR